MAIGSVTKRQCATPRLRTRRAANAGLAEAQVAIVRRSRSAGWTTSGSVSRRRAGSSRPRGRAEGSALSHFSRDEHLDAVSVRPATRGFRYRHAADGRREVDSIGSVALAAHCETRSRAARSLRRARKGGIADAARRGAVAFRERGRSSGTAACRSRQPRDSANQTLPSGPAVTAASASPLESAGGVIPEENACRMRLARDTEQAEHTDRERNLRSEPTERTDTAPPPCGTHTPRERHQTSP